MIAAQLCDGSHAHASSTHWAFQPPSKPGPPAVKEGRWIRNDLDRFVLQRLEASGLKPSPEADRATLLRRLSLDLIGLPPSPAELDAFLRDRSPDAYSHQVERLLSSPHYGERWARWWLDAARYADSDGYEKDLARDMSGWRDYVIQAFNKDLPYNQFIVEQLAGDEIPQATQDQIVATGFLRNSMINEEGAIDAEQFRMDAMFDRMDCIGKSVLGLTIQCGQCHNHKYDPFSQDDYYGFFAFLNNSYEAQTKRYTDAEQKVIAEIHAGTERLEAALKQRMPEWKSRIETWEAQERKRAESVRWQIPAVVDAGVPDGICHPTKLPDGSLLTLGFRPTKTQYFIVVDTQLPRVTGVRLEALTHGDLGFQGPGRSRDGIFALSEFRLESAALSATNNKVRIPFTKATADFGETEHPLGEFFRDGSTNQRSVGPIQFAIDGTNRTAWGIDAGPGRRNQDRKAVFQITTNACQPGGTRLTFWLDFEHGGASGNGEQNNFIGRVRLSLTDSPNPEADPLPKTVRDLLSVPAAQRTPGQWETLFGYWRTTVPEFESENREIDQLWKRHPEGASALVMATRSGQDVRETRLLTRGDWLKPTRTIQPSLPDLLNPMKASTPTSRLAFARWMMDRRSPTVARVAVNRVWQSLFGQGIHPTPEDFGVQTKAPEHQMLLDWLACEFMDHGWSLKSLQRLIVESAAYRQSSRQTPALHALDPSNQTFARGPRFRVDGEQVLDIALAASGLLTRTVGGTSTHPPVPDNLAGLAFAQIHWPTETGPERYRRALYAFRRRSVPYPVLQNFDAPNGDAACVRRNRSNTPLQALTTLNETLFFEAAQALALRAWKEGGSDDLSRLRYAFRLCTGRYPEAKESRELLQLLRSREQRFSEGWTDPKPVAMRASAGSAELPTGGTPTRMAAWTLVTRVLLNLDETITKN